jgi:hypothetical protein
VQVKWGYEWMEEWHVDYRCGITDERGFYYAPTFVAMQRVVVGGEVAEIVDTAEDTHMSEQGVASTSDRPFQQYRCRSRCWRRKMRVSFFTGESTW